MKEEFLKILRTVNREGMEDFIKFLESTDFFTAPASTRFHGNYAGGLVEHSMKVYEILEATKGILVSGNKEDDICFFSQDSRQMKNGGMYIPLNKFL